SSETALTINEVNRMEEIIEETQGEPYVPFFRKNEWKPEWTDRITTENLPYDTTVLTSDDVSPWAELLENGHLRCKWCNEAVNQKSKTGFEIKLNKKTPNIVTDAG